MSFARRVPYLMVSLLFAASISSLAGFAPPLGRKWRTMRTDHFLFYFYAETEPLARRLAPAAERIHDRLVDELRMPPAQPTHVLIYDDTDEANGAATVLPRNTIHLFATSDYTGGYGRAGDTLLETFVHEYTHILQLGYVADLPEAVNDAIGGVLYPNMLLPPWCTEGLAVAMESEFFPSGRLQSSTWRMYLRADFLAGKTLSWSQVNNGVYRWPYGNAAYLYGSFFTRYLIDQYGREKVTEFYRATGGGLPYLFWAQAFEVVFGLPLRTVQDAWHARMRAAFRAEAERISGAGLVEGTPVASLGGLSGEGSFAPDGRLYFLRRTGRAPSRLMVAAPPFRTARALGGLQASRPAVSPDGRRLLYGLASPRGGNIFSDLFLLDLKTGRTRRLTKSLRASDPSWSPDGRRIAFIRNAPPNYHLYVMPADGGRPEPLLRAEGLAQAYTPAWSPRGDRIAFARFKPGDGQRILLIRPDGAEEAPLHAGPPLGEEMEPAWSPDGRYVFFAADPTGVFNIYACDAENGSLWQVTNVLTGAYAPAVSPDGRTLAYTGYSPAGYDQYTLPLDPAAWRLYVPGPRMTEEGEKPAGPPTSYFYAAEAATDAPAEPYSPWRTLAPGFGFASVSIDASGDYALELYLDGSDILETTHYAVLLGGSSLGFDCQAQVDLRLRSLTLTLLGGQEHEDHAFGVDPAGFILNRQYYQVLLEGGAAGLLSPGDGFSWAATAYLVREREIHADHQTAPESVVGAEAAAQYGRTTVYGGPVDLAEGYVLGYRIGTEEQLGSGSRVNWQSAWGSIFLPVADQCRLELTGTVKENSAGAAAVDFGVEGLALLRGSLVGEARTELEYPLIVAERGGEVSPWYLHGVNGLAVLAAGQSLDPAAGTMCGAGLGLKFRLQMGYLMPLDLSVLYLRTSSYDSYWTLGMEMPY